MAIMWSYCEVLPSFQAVQKLKDRPSTHSWECHRSFPVSIWNSPSFPCLIGRGDRGRSQLQITPAAIGLKRHTLPLPAHRGPWASGKKQGFFFGRGFLFFMGVWSVVQTLTWSWRTVWESTRSLRACWFCFSTNFLNCFLGRAKTHTHTHTHCCSLSIVHD